MADPLQPIWQRADIREPVFTADDVSRWTGGAVVQLVQLGILSAISNAQTMACHSCGHDHLEEVVFIESPAGSGLRAYIACPDAGRIAVSLERLRRWTIDFSKLARATAVGLDVAGELEDLVASRLWQLGKLTISRQSVDVFFLRGATWEDAPEIIGRHSGLLRRACPLILVPGTIPEADFLPTQELVLLPTSAFLTLAESGIACDHAYLETACGKRHGVGEPATPVEPQTLLTGWREIAAALGQTYASRDKIKSLNARFGGPIRHRGRGTQPIVNKGPLLGWWNKLAVLQQELANRSDGTRLSVDLQYCYGREGVVTPEIGGSVKNRRKKRPG